MHSERLSIAAAAHAKLREALKAEYGLADDDTALADTLDGISDFKELVAVAAQQALYEEAMAKAIDVMIENMAQRSIRRENKANRIRNCIKQAMLEAGEKKIDAPAATITIAAGKKSIDIRAPEPTEAGSYVKTKITHSWDKTALAKGLDEGDEAAKAIAHYRNPEPVLTIRTK